MKADERLQQVLQSTQLHTQLYYKSCSEGMNAPLEQYLVPAKDKVNLVYSRSKEQERPSHHLRKY